MMVIGHTIIVFNNELFIMFYFILFIIFISCLYTSLHIYIYKYMCSKLLHLVLKQ